MTAVTCSVKSLTHPLKMCGLNKQKGVKSIAHKKFIVRTLIHSLLGLKLFINSVSTRQTVLYQHLKVMTSDNKQLHTTIENDLFDYLLEDLGEGDVVGMILCNEGKQSDKPIGISFRRKDQSSSDVIWSMFDKFSQYNSRLDTMWVVIYSVK